MVLAGFFIRLKPGKDEVKIKKTIIFAIVSLSEDGWDGHQLTPCDPGHMVEYEGMNESLPFVFKQPETIRCFD